MGVLSRWRARRELTEATATAAAPLRLCYGVQLRNLTTGETSPLYDSREYIGHDGFDDGIARVCSGHDPARIEIVETYEGGGMPAGQRVLWSKDYPPQEQDDFTMRVKDLHFATHSSTSGRLVHDHPLQRAVRMDTLADGRLRLRLVESTLQVEQSRYSSHVSVLVKAVVLAEAMLDTDDAATTAEGAEFLADAQASIDEYEALRRATAGTADADADAIARKAADAAALREVLTQTMAQLQADRMR